MKKTLFFLLGALFVAMLPNVNVNAQATYQVTFHNWDYLGNDSVRVCPANSIISPVQATPYHDTIIIAWYTDAALTTPWDFATDIVTDNMEMWPNWQVVPTGDRVYRIATHLQAFDGADVYPISGDTLSFVCTPGVPIIVNAPTMTGFTPKIASIGPMILPATDTVFNFNYTRNKHKITYNLKGGQFTDGTPNPQFYYYQQTVAPISNNVVRPNCEFLNWNPMFLLLPSGMPDRDIELEAMYAYHVFWTSDSMEYNGQPANLNAYYINDYGFNWPVGVNYVDANNVRSANAVAAGTYSARALDTSLYYKLVAADTMHNYKINPFMLTISGWDVDTVKYYDATSDAKVNDPGTCNAFSGTNVTLSATARFSDAFAGENKSIVAFYSLGGADAANYTVPDTILISRNGAIIFPIRLQYPEYDIDANGYCGTVTIGYNLDTYSATPDQFMIFFDEDALAHGFTNTGWQNITTPGKIIFSIPDEAVGHWYSPTIILRNSAHPDFVSDTTLFPPFHANLPNTTVVAIFSDVLSIVDTCQCFGDTLQWYKNGVPIPGAIGKWYQDPEGLNGTYHVDVKMHGEPTWTCDSAYTFQTAGETMSMTTYPNPATDVVNISLANSSEYTHSMVLMNVMGVTLANTTFNGNDTTIDLRGLPHGTYTVIVDGLTARVIKR